MRRVQREGHSLVKGSWGLNATERRVQGEGHSCRRVLRGSVAPSGVPRGRAPLAYAAFSEGTLWGGSENAVVSTRAFSNNLSRTLLLR